MRHAARGLWIVCIGVVCAVPALAQSPVVVAFDEGHFNVHSLQTPYQALGEVASELGFVPRAHAGPFSAASLEGVRVLVACCARAADTGPLADRGRPAHREDELDALERWVGEGGALLLVIDHYPIGGANEALAVRFGVDVLNGRTEDAAIEEDVAGRVAEAGGEGTVAVEGGALVFDRARNRIGDHPITCGRNIRERIDRVATFGGASLRARSGATPLLLFSDSSIDLVGPDTIARSALGRNQGLALIHERGRVVVLGEAAMLFNYEQPGLQNRQFAANVLRWLAGELPATSRGCRG